MPLSVKPVSLASAQLLGAGGVEGAGGDAVPPPRGPQSAQLCGASSARTNAA